jgi:hypothetical protein
MIGLRGKWFYKENEKYDLPWMDAEILQGAVLNAPIASIPTVHCALITVGLIPQSLLRGSS